MVNSYLLLTRLYQLKIFNYKIMSRYKLFINGDLNYKSICKERLEVRKKIQTELTKSIFKVRNENCSEAGKPLLYIISKILKGSFSLEFLYHNKDWPGLQRCEMNNLHLYYKALYTPRAPKTIINLLLGQKKMIEDYLHRE